MAEGSSEVTSDGSKQLAQAIDAAVQATIENETRRSISRRLRWH